MAWTAPRTWLLLEQITATYLNEQVRDNLDYLFNRPRSIIDIANGSNINVTSTTFAAVDDNQFTVELETAGGDVELNLRLQVSVPANAVVAIDFLIDNTNYVSSGTSTPLTNGISTVPQTTAAVVGTTNVRAVVQGLSAGVHNFKLRMRTSTGTAVVTLANILTQLSAWEV
jgi:hypothetical protein